MLTFSFVPNTNILTYFLPNLKPSDKNREPQNSSNQESNNECDVVKSNYNFFCDYRSKVSELVKYELNAVSIDDVTNLAKLIETLEEYKTIIGCLAEFLSEKKKIKTNWIDFVIQRNLQKEKNTCSAEENTMVKNEKFYSWMIDQKNATHFPFFGKKSGSSKRPTDFVDAFGAYATEKIQILMGNEVIEVEDLTSIGKSPKIEPANNFTDMGVSEEYGEYSFCWNGYESKSMTFEYCCVLYNLFIAKLYMAFKKWDGIKWNGGNFLANPCQCFGFDLFSENLNRTYNFVRSNSNTDDAKRNVFFQLFSNIFTNAAGKSTTMSTNCNVGNPGVENYLEKHASEISKFEATANILTGVSNLLAESVGILEELEKYSNFVENLQLYEMKKNDRPPNALQKIGKLCSLKFKFTKEAHLDLKKMIFSIHTTTFVDNFLLRTAILLKQMEREKKSKVDMYVECKKRWDFIRGFIWSYHVECKSMETFDKKHYQKIFLAISKQHLTQKQLELFHKILKAKKESKIEKKNANNRQSGNQKLGSIFENFLDDLHAAEKNKEIEEIVDLYESISQLFFNRSCVAFNEKDLILIPKKHIGQKSLVFNAVAFWSKALWLNLIAIQDLFSAYHFSFVEGGSKSIPTTEGYGLTFLSQKYFRIVKYLSTFSEKLKEEIGTLRQNVDFKKLKEYCHALQTRSNLIRDVLADYLKTNHITIKTSVPPDLLDYSNIPSLLKWTSVVANRCKITTKLTETNRNSVLVKISPTNASLENHPKIIETTRQKVDLGNQRDDHPELRAFLSNAHPIGSFGECANNYVPTPTAPPAEHDEAKTPNKKQFFFDLFSTTLKSAMSSYIANNRIDVHLQNELGTSHNAFQWRCRDDFCADYEYYLTLFLKNANAN